MQSCLNDHSEDTIYINISHEYEKYVEVLWNAALLWLDVSQLVLGPHWEFWLNHIVKPNKPKNN